MWNILFALSLFTIAIDADTIIPTTKKKTNDSVDVRYELLYADEDVSLLNEVVTIKEKSQALKYKDKMKDSSTKSLPSEDVKCLMSVDRFCSKKMKETKDVLIQAIREDCKRCTEQQKTDAGKVIASMMAYDPVAWKIFLTRSIVLSRYLSNANGTKSGKQSRKAQEKLKLVRVGEPEVLQSSKNAIVMPGAKVKIIRTRLKPLDQV